MLTRNRKIATAMAIGLYALATREGDARACGGGAFYTVDTQSEATSVSGHRVVLSLSTTQTVLWDQITYAGAPGDFAWVMPVPSGSRLDVAASAWIESLSAMTETVVASPSLFCSSGSGSGSASEGCGCPFGAGAAGDGAGTRGTTEPPPVTIVHEGTVGPYETVTLKSDMPGAVSDWLTTNGYKIPADIQPILDDYTAKKMDFIALRLKPEASVKQMQPVRVVMPGGITTFPMRMLAAGAPKSVALQVFVITEGRMSVQGFPGATITSKDVTWDFNADKSNYVALREEALAKDGSKTWLTSYAKKNPFFTPLSAGVSGGDSSEPDPIVPPQIAILDYFNRGVSNAETADSSCVSGVETYLNEINTPRGPAGYVVDVCSNASTGMCGTAGVGAIDARKLECKGLEDLGVAPTGLHPADVWLTRLEAELPREALTQDLTLEPAASQSGVENVYTAKQVLNKPSNCSVSGAPLSALDTASDDDALPRPPSRRGLAAITLMLSALLLGLSRRAQRLRPALALAR